MDFAKYMRYRMYRRRRPEHAFVMESKSMTQQKQELPPIEPAGGWKQYNLAIFVLVLYPILILGCALAIFWAVPSPNRPNPNDRVEIVAPASHEPFHLSLSVLPGVTQAPAGS